MIVNQNKVTSNRIKAPLFDSDEDDLPSNSTNFLRSNDDAEELLRRRKNQRLIILHVLSIN